MNPTLNSQPKVSRLPEIIAVIMVVCAIGYYFYSSSNSNSGTSFTISTATTSVGSSVLNLLNQIQSLRIDTSMFQSPVYQSLVDFTLQIPPENIGKANPFLPIGTPGNNLSESQTPVPQATSSTSLSTSTGQ